MAAVFTPQTMRFLRGLAKHNAREWFEARRPIYEEYVKQPLHALIAGVNVELADFAPEYVRPPHKIAMRIFRDTRFSPDKRPYKTHLAAWWARQGLEKTSAAGFFVQFGPEGGFAAAGVYAPERDDLLLLRRWLAEHHQRYRDGLGSVLQPKRGNTVIRLMDDHALTRNPKGFAPAHPASDLLRGRNWGVTAAFAADAALKPGFETGIAAQFRRMAPLVCLLNEPFVAKKASSSTWRP